MRFAFGKNWRSFLSVINERRIHEAERALLVSLDRENMTGMRVLDIGSGSGLSSLAMRRLGARVVSFDYDADSVACTSELRRRFDGESDDWLVLQGSVLDPEFMTALGKFDLVYAWGVLHHTGSMWPALDLAQQRVVPGGQLLIALYNDQGWRSKLWWHIKHLYCGGRIGRVAVCAVFYPLFALYAVALDLRRLKLPGAHMREYARRRGMSLVHDWRDWLGGFPFEVARPVDVVERLGKTGFTLKHKALTRGWGCNEFTLVKSANFDGH